MKLSVLLLFLLCRLASTKSVFGADHLRGSIKSLDAAVDGESDDHVLRRLTHGDKIPGAFIVRFSDSILDVKGKANALIKQYGGVQGFVYERTVKGFSVSKLPDAQAEKLAATEGVKYVEPDQVAMSAARPTPTQSFQTIPWGIKRVHGPVAYVGSNAAWVLDSGIDLDHPDLNVDSMRCKSFIVGDPSCDDPYGHGTQ